MNPPTLNHTIDGHAVTIRPIRSTDGDMVAEFVRQLSPKSRYFRFLGGVKELSPKQLRHFCDVDGEHTMAFVATIDEQGREVEIGVARYAPCSTDDAREMAITVADKWQRKGLGSLLVKQLADAAREHGIERLFSVDLVDNAEMRQLAKDLDMTAKPDPEDSYQVIYSLAV